MRRGYTLRDLIVALVVVSLAAALLVPTIHRAHRRSRITACVSNLSNLAKEMYNWSGCCHMRPAWLQPDAPRGSAFWVLIYNEQQLADPRILQCPVRPRGEPVSYRGPASHIDDYDAPTAIGADRPDNHFGPEGPSLNWVAKSGDVHRMPAKSPRWEAVMKSTMD